MSVNSQELTQIPLSGDEFPSTLRSLGEGLAEGVAPGFVAGIWTASNPDLIRVTALGQRRVVPSSLPMQVNTPFDLASISKVFATATLTALLVERGWLNWNTRVQSILPECRWKGIEIRHLLSHTAGLPWWRPLWEDMRKHFIGHELHKIPVLERQAQMRRQVFAIDPELRPGEKAVYSDITFLTLGFALEAVTQMPLNQAVKHLLWAPMGVQGAHYRPVIKAVDELPDDRYAATEKCPWRGGVLQWQVHDDNCWSMGGYGGHAGTFGTVQDVLHFSQRLLGGFLSQEVMRAAWGRVNQPVGCDRTLGWDSPSQTGSSLGDRFSRRSVGHLGFTGTSLWIDPDSQVAITLLSNRVHPSRENVGIKIFRSKFHEAVWDDLHR